MTVQFFLGLSKFVEISLIFVLQATRRHQIVAEVFSYNPGVLLLLSACRIDDVRRNPYRVIKIITFVSKIAS